MAKVIRARRDRIATFMVLRSVTWVVPFVMSLVGCGCK